MTVQEGCERHHGGGKGHEPGVFVVPGMIRLVFRGDAHAHRGCVVCENETQDDG